MDTQPAQALYDIARPSNRVGLHIVSLDQAHAPNKVLAHIGIMGACNMRCNFRNFHSPTEENFYDLFSFRHSIPADKATGLLREFSGTGGRAVTFCGSGECTIHPGYAAPGGRRLHRTHTWVRIGMNAVPQVHLNSRYRARAAWEESNPYQAEVPATLHADFV